MFCTCICGIPAWWTGKGRHEMFQAIEWWPQWQLMSFRAPADSLRAWWKRTDRRWLFSNATLSMALPCLLLGLLLSSRNRGLLGGGKCEARRSDGLQVFMPPMVPSRILLTLLTTCVCDVLDLLCRCGLFLASKSVFVEVTSTRSMILFRVGRTARCRSWMSRKNAAREILDQDSLVGAHPLYRAADSHPLSKVKLSAFFSAIRGRCRSRVFVAASIPCWQLCSLV